MLKVQDQERKAMQMVFGAGLAIVLFLLAGVPVIGLLYQV